MFKVVAKVGVDAKKTSTVKYKPRALVEHSPIIQGKRLKQKDPKFQPSLSELVTHSN